MDHTKYKTPSLLTHAKPVQIYRQVMRLLHCVDKSNKEALYNTKSHEAAHPSAMRGIQDEVHKTTNYKHFLETGVDKSATVATNEKSAIIKGTATAIAH